MANDNSELDLQLLLKIASQVDPNVHANIQKSIDEMQALGMTVAQVSAQLAALGRVSFPDVLRQTQQMSASIKAVLAALPPGAPRASTLPGYQDVNSPGDPFVSRRKAAEYLAFSMKAQQDAAAEIVRRNMAAGGGIPDVLQGIRAGNPSLGVGYGPFPDVAAEAARRRQQQQYDERVAREAAQRQRDMTSPQAPLTGAALQGALNSLPSLTEAIVTKITSLSPDKAYELWSRASNKFESAVAGGASRATPGMALQEDVATLLKYQAFLGSGAQGAGALRPAYASGGYGPSVTQQQYAAQQAAAARPRTMQPGTVTQVSGEWANLVKAAEALGNSKAVDAIDAWGSKMNSLGKSSKETDSTLTAMVQRDFPKVWELYSGKLGEADKQQQNFNSTARQTPSVLSGILQSLQRVGEYVAGNLIAAGIKSVINTVAEIIPTVEGMVASFVNGGIAVNASLQLINGEMNALLGGAKQAATALDFIKQKSVAAPFNDIPKIADAVRIMTAFGLDYAKWFDTVNAISIAFNKPIENVVRAIGQLGTGATGRALLSLRLLGINVKEAGIEVDKAGHAIGTTQELMAKLEAYVTARFKNLLPDISDTWVASLQRIQNTWTLLEQAFTKPIFNVLLTILKPLNDFLSHQDSNGLQDNLINLQAFAEVLGEIPARGIERFVSFFRDSMGLFTGGAAGFFEGAVKLVTSFADGLLSGFTDYVMPAVETIVAGIASFLIGHSPPERGPLSQVVEGARAVIAAYVNGLKAGLDYAALNELGALVAAAIKQAVAVGDISESGGYTIEINMRQVVAQALEQLQTLGSFSQAIADNIRANFGAIGQEVLDYLNLAAQLNAAQKAEVQSQKEVEEATKKVTEIQEKQRWLSLLSSDIPERYTRGAKRALDIQLLQAQEEEKRSQAAAKASNDRVKELNAQMTGLKNYFQELQKIWALEDARLKALKKEQTTETDPNAALGRIDTRVQDALNKAKAAWEDWFKVHVYPALLTLEGHFTKIGDLIRGFMGATFTRPEMLPGESRQEYADRVAELQAAFNKASQGDLFQQGVKLRENLGYIVDNAPKLVKDIGTIATFVMGIAGDFMNIGTDIKGIYDNILAGWNSLPKDLRDWLLYGTDAYIASHPEQMKSASDDFWGGFKKGSGLSAVQGMLEGLNGILKGVDLGAASEGLYKPIITKAQDASDAVVGKSIIPDMIDSILTALRRMNVDVIPVMSTFYDRLLGWSRFISLDMTQVFRSMVDTILADLARIPSTIPQPQIQGPPSPLVQPSNNLNLLGTGAGVSRRSAGSFSNAALNVSTNLVVNVPITRADETWLRETITKHTYEGVTKVFGNVDIRRRSN